MNRVQRNRNPLNIKLSNVRWFGQDMQGKDKTFCTFKTMEHGWRAAFVLICQTYYHKYGKKTIRDIITRLAPSTENNTEAYIKTVSTATGIKADEQLGPPLLNPLKWFAIIMAMSRVEAGIDLNVGEAYRGWKLWQKTSSI